jgi:hypothetical protein
MALTTEFSSVPALEPAGAPIVEVLFVLLEPFDAVLLLFWVTDEVTLEHAASANAKMPLMKASLIRIGSDLHLSYRIG